MDDVQVFDRALTAEEIGYPYSELRTHDEIGNITSKDGVTFSYSASKPHALTNDGKNNFSYDANGNMTSRWSKTFTWNAENRLASIGTTSTTETVLACRRTRGTPSSTPTASTRRTPTAVSS